jgi:hypothetical protein
MKEKLEATLREMLDNAARPTGSPKLPVHTLLDHRLRPQGSLIVKDTALLAA